MTDARADATEPDGTIRPSWLDSDEWVVVISDDPESAPGHTEDHVAIGAFFSNLVRRRKEDVEKNVEKLGRQMTDLMAKLPQEQQGFHLTEISFELGFSAEGELAFIAKAGLSASVSVKFSRP